MNADWRSPVQPDHLESDVKQDTNYPQFLKEQDAMDNMLWGDVAISPTNPWSDSQDITYFERGSIMDLGCVCNYFPPLYCARHGIDFDTFKDNDMPLPSFDPGQTITHSDDVLESVEAAPGHLELTEESLTGQSLFQSFQNPFEMGQDDPGISTNDRDIPTPKYLDAHLSPRPPRQNRSGRSKIPPRDKRILKAHFARNPYPTDSELDELHKRTSLAIKCIKTWFNNFRHRTAPHRSLIIRSPPETPKRDMSETPSQASTSVSAESLRRLDRASPAQSTSSLERYLATPLIEEAIPSAAIKPLMEASIMSKHDVVLERKRNMRQGNLERRFNADAERRFRADAERQFNETLQRKGFKTKAIRSTLRRTGGAGSVAGSDSSMDSGSSVGSWTSQNSADSRGSRKGRKSWVQAPNHITAASPSSKDPPPFEIPIAVGYTMTTQPPNLPWYCTTPECNKSFRYRSEWDRHEVAVHHWPYHWVCNLGEQPSTVHKDAASRIFYREDQLLVHMMKAHPGSVVSKDSASALKTENPTLNPTSLRCGFCYQDFCSWEERQDHVFAHMQDGVPKSLWLWRQNTMLSTDETYEVFARGWPQEKNDNELEAEN